MHVDLCLVGIHVCVHRYVAAMCRWGQMLILGDLLYHFSCFHVSD